ncbi:unnamed protein product [Prunus brigantina]
MECIEEVVENYVNLHIAIVDDSIALFNSHDTFEVVEYIDFMRVENFSRHNATTLVDTIIQNIWFKRLAMESLHNWRIFKYSKYLFLWSGRFQFEDQQSMIMILIHEGINSRHIFVNPGRMMLIRSVVLWSLMLEILFGPFLPRIVFLLMNITN